MAYKLSPYTIAKAEKDKGVVAHDLNPDEDPEILLTVTLTKQEKQILELLWEQLKERSILQSTDSIGLGIMSILIKQFSELHRRLEGKDEIERQDYNVLMRLSSQILDYLKQYGMTPSSRRNMENLINSIPSDSEMEKLLNETDSAIRKSSKRKPGRHSKDDQVDS